MLSPHTYLAKLQNTDDTKCWQRHGVTGFWPVAAGNARWFFAATTEGSVLLDFPGGLVVKNLHASVGDMASMLGLGRIPHATEHLSPCAATTKPVLQLLRPASLEPMLCNRRGHRSAKACTRAKRVSSTCPKWRKPVYDNEHTAQPKKWKSLKKKENIPLLWPSKSYSLAWTQMNWILTSTYTQCIMQVYS